MFIKVGYPGLKFRSRKTLSRIDTVTDFGRRMSPRRGCCADQARGGGSRTPRLLYWILPSVFEQGFSICFSCLVGAFSPCLASGFAFFILLVMVAFPFVLCSFPGRQLAFLQLLLSMWTLRSHLRLCPASSKLCELGGTATLSVLSFLYLERKKKKKESKGLLRFISGGHYAY